MSPPDVPKNQNLKKAVKVKGPKVNAQPVQPTQAQIPPTTYPSAQVPTPTAAPQIPAYTTIVQGQTSPAYPAYQTPTQPRQPVAAQPQQYTQPIQPTSPPAQVPRVQTTPTQVQQPQPAAAPAVTPKVAPGQKPKVKLTRKPGRPKPRQKHALPPKPKKGVSQFRYRTQIIKGSILPILYGIVSIQMLNKYSYEWPDFFEYNLMLILFGFLLGFASMSGITIANLSRAKRKLASGVKLDLRTGIIAFMPFIIITIVLAFIYSLSFAWQFSTGYFLAAIFPMLIVLVYEYSSKKKFFIQESTDAPSEGRILIAVSSA